MSADPDAPVLSGCSQGSKYSALAVDEAAVLFPLTGDYAVASQFSTNRVAIQTSHLMMHPSRIVPISRGFFP